MNLTDEKTVAKAAERWQRCRQEDLPRLFYAFNADDGKRCSERLVSYGLDAQAINKLTSDVDLKTAFNFVVVLGMEDIDIRGPVGDTPAFTLYLRVVVDGTKDQQYHCQKLNWVRDSRFTRQMETGTNSRRNAIPAASAYLFVQSWQELPEMALARPFTAASRDLGRRVKSYTFTCDESRSILRDLLLSGKQCLEIHLGNGLAVYDHPFSFRPVIEVRGGATAESNKAALAGINRLTNDAGDSFYDFGDPDLPDLPDPPK